MAEIDQAGAKHRDAEAAIAMRAIRLSSYEMPAHGSAIAQIESKRNFPAILPCCC